MKALRIIALLGLIGLAAAAGWYFGRQAGDQKRTASTGRKILYYQSAMHPWIKSDKPGRCTICGMELVPVYEGDKALEFAADTVSLSSNSINVLNIQTEAAQVRPLERTLEVAGRIEAEEPRFRVISAYVDGRIDKLFVNYVGAEAEQGQPLALLYSPPLLTAEREYLTLAEQTNWDASSEFGAEHQKLIGAAAQRLTRLGLSSTQIAGLQTRGATELNTQILAPISGTVITRSVSEGQYVKEGEKLFDIADLSKMWFRFEVYEQDLSALHVGDIVQVNALALDGKTFHGPITFIDPNLNEATRSARVRVELDNPLVQEGTGGKRTLFNGLYATGHIMLRSQPVLAISRAAVIDPGDSPRVYVNLGGGAYQQRRVTLGRTGADVVEVLRGLAGGEKVVINGSLLLDAQSQINRSASPDQQYPSQAQESTDAISTLSNRIAATQGNREPPLKSVPLPKEQAEAAANILDLLSRISSVLASDDLSGFNRETRDFSSKVAPVLNKLKANAHFLSLAERIEKDSSLKPAEGLPEARSQFFPLSMAAADLLRALREHGINPPAHLYKCPMYPGSGKTAYWVQTDGAIRNPFFGSEMLDCGTEVK